MRTSPFLILDIQNEAVIISRLAFGLGHAFLVPLASFHTSLRPVRIDSCFISRTTNSSLQRLGAALSLRSPIVTIEIFSLNKDSFVGVIDQFECCVVIINRAYMNRPSLRCFLFFPSFSLPILLSFIFTLPFSTPSLARPPHSDCSTSLPPVPPSLPLSIRNRTFVSRHIETDYLLQTESTIYRIFLLSM